jgi:hypothetical protein
MTSKRDRFLSDAFLKAAVAVKAEYVLVKDRVLGGVETGCRALARERVPNGVADALAERTGCRFHAGRFVKFRVSGSVRSHGAEMFHVVARDRVAGQVQPTI